MRWYFDDSKCKTYLDITVNSVSTSNDDRHRTGMIFSLMSSAHDGTDSDDEAMELTLAYDNSRTSGQAKRL